VIGTARRKLGNPRSKSMFGYTPKLHLVKYQSQVMIIPIWAS